MALNAWQKIDRVLAGQPFGSGSDGPATITSDPNKRGTATGTLESTSLTTNNSTFSNGDVVLLHQTRGSGYWQWEINRIASGGGTTSLTMQKDLQYTYVSGAQIIKIPMYSVATVNSYSITAWNGSVGGVGVIAGGTSITVASSNTITGTGNGYRGGSGQPDPANTSAGTGESGAGDPGTEVTGAGICKSTNSGSGGGYGTAGGDGQGDNSGGDAHGTADLTSISMGGAGGGGSSNPTGGAGGDSGCILILIGKTITVSGSIANNGAAGSTVAGGRGGGGGSGGAILFVANTASLGSSAATATGGAAGGGDVSGGVGGVGRIAVHHSGTIGGSTTPSYEDVEDSSLVETTDNAIFFGTNI